MKKFAVLFMASLVALFIACSGSQKKEEKTEKMEPAPKPAVEKKVEYARTAEGNPIVTVETSMGNFDVEVFEKDCPIHAANFLKLVEADYYSDMIFHRVVPDFMIQTGDPLGTGRGTPGYMLDQEKKPFKYTNKRGFLAMAQTADGQINGSQFYILVKDSPHLNDKFPCFGKVISGMDVVDAISKVKTKSDRPIEDVKLIDIAPKAPAVAASSEKAGE